MWDTPIYAQLRREMPVSLPDEEVRVEIEVHVLQVDGGDTLIDEWFMLPAVPREGEMFNLGIERETHRISEVYWLPAGTEENTNSHVAVFLEGKKGTKNKKAHPWKR